MKGSILTIVIISLLLNGCYGAGVVVLHARLTTREPIYKGEDKNTLLKIRGKPADFKVNKDGSESITYKRGLGWSGIIPYVAFFFPIPLPLLIPTHSNWEKYRIVDGRVKSVTTKYTDSPNCFIGYAPENEGTMLYHWYASCQR